MTPAEALASHRAFINEVGEDIVIRRFTGVGTPRPHTDTVTKARVVGYQPSEVIGAIVQGDRRVIALVDSLSEVLPVTTNDAVVIRGAKELKIIAVDDSTRRIAGTLVALEIQVRG